MVFSVPSLQVLSYIYVSLNGICVMLLLLFSLSKEAILSFSTTSWSSSPSLYLCPSHSLSANVGCIYLFYLGMSDSWVCGSTCCNREICRNCRRRRRQSLNQYSRDWIQCVLHVYLIVSECLLTSRVSPTHSLCLNQTSLCTQESVDCT